jgi:hypothetical protein
MAELKARRLDAIAKWINAHSATLRMVATTMPTSVHTNTKPDGFRYFTHVGKGRKGVLFEVYPADAAGQRQPGPRFWWHNSAETYAVNATVERWLAEYILGLDAGHRRKLKVPHATLVAWSKS